MTDGRSGGRPTTEPATPTDTEQHQRNPSVPTTPVRGMPERERRALHEWVAGGGNDLTARERAAEIARCRAAGWAEWEIAKRFGGAS